MRRFTRAALAIVLPILAVAILLFVLAGCDVINPPPPEEVVILGTKQIHEFETGTVVTSSWMVIDNEIVTRKITLGDLLMAELPAAVSTLVVTESLDVGGPTTVVTFTATGPVTFADDMTVLGESTVVTLTATGPVSVTSLVVVETTDLHGPVTITDSLGLRGDIAVAGASDFQGQIRNSAGNVVISDTLEIQQDPLAALGVVVRHSSDIAASEASVTMQKSRGTIDSPTIVVVNDALGVIDFQSWDGGDYLSSATIQAFSDSPPGVDDVPGRLTFSTTPDNTNNPVERMRIDNAGLVMVHDGTVPSWDHAPSSFAAEEVSEFDGLIYADGGISATTVDASDAVSIATTLGVVGDVDLMGDIADSSGNLTLNDDVDVSGTLSVTGNAGFVGDVDLMGDIADSSGILRIADNVQIRTGDAGSPALQVSAQTAQSVDTFIVENSNGDDWFSISNSGVISGSQGGSIAGGWTIDNGGLQAASGATVAGNPLTVTTSITNAGSYVGAGDHDIHGAQTITGTTTLGNNLTFTGSGLGLQHGYVWGNEITWTQASAAQNTWYNISDSDMTSGPLNGIGHDGNGKITVTVAGMYTADWSGDGEATAANQHIQMTFSVDGTATEFGQNHFETIGVNRGSSTSGVAILDLAAGQTVQVAVRTTDAGTPDLFVDHLHFRLVQIAGT